MSAPPRAILPSDFMHGASRDDLKRLRELLPELGFKLVQVGSDWAIEERRASSDSSFLRLIPLTNRESGKLRRDAVKHLVNAKWLADAREASESSRLALENATINGPLRKLEQIQFDLLFNPNPFPALEEYLRHQPDVMLYRLIGTEKFTHRQSVWRALSRTAEDGLSWSDQRARQEVWASGLSAGSRVGGFFPIQYICIPMLARQQPLAMAFLTARGAQIIAVPKYGGWPRGQNLTGWPTAGASMTLSGSGEKLYTSRFKKIPELHPIHLLDDLVSNGERMLDYLTNPIHWTDAGGEIQVLERNAAWVSFELGTSALVEMAKDWTSPETTWTAFRALTVLEGLWGPSIAKLGKLLDPRILKGQVIAHFPNDHYREWAEDIATNFETALTSAFGGSLEDAIVKAEDVRHLLHGARAREKAKPMRRLEMLRNIESAAIQLVRDIAVFWWAAIILAPDHFCPPKAPSI